MILHTLDVLTFSFSAVIWMVDTDVLVLAIVAAAKNKERDLHVSFGARDSHHMIHAPAMATAIGYDKVLLFQSFMRLLTARQCLQRNPSGKNSLAAMKCF